jgi:hypothetical protein
MFRIHFIIFTRTRLSTFLRIEGKMQQKSEKKKKRKKKGCDRGYHYLFSLRE